MHMYRCTHTHTYIYLYILIWIIFTYIYMCLCICICNTHIKPHHWQPVVATRHAPFGTRLPFYPVLVLFVLGGRALPRMEVLEVASSPSRPAKQWAAGENGMKGSGCSWKSCLRSTSKFVPQSARQRVIQPKNGKNTTKETQREEGEGERAGDAKVKWRQWV